MVREQRAEYEPEMDETSEGGTMTNVWYVRAEFGTYTEHFVSGGYVAPVHQLPAADEAFDLREQRI